MSASGSWGGTLLKEIKCLIAKSRKDICILIRCFEYADVQRGGEGGRGCRSCMQGESCSSNAFPTIGHAQHWVMLNSTDKPHWAICPSQAQWAELPISFSLVSLFSFTHLSLISTCPSVVPKASSAQLILLCRTVQGDFLILAGITFMLWLSLVTWLTNCWPKLLTLLKSPSITLFH